MNLNGLKYWITGSWITGLVLFNIFNITKINSFVDYYNVNGHGGGKIMLWSSHSKCRVGRHTLSGTCLGVALSHKLHQET